MAVHTAVTVRWILIALVLVLVACSSPSQDDTQAYSTSGAAYIQTCRGFGIKSCDDAPSSVPTLINVNDSHWAGLWSEQKGAGYTMCYEKLHGGIFTDRLLMFRCKPLTNQGAPQPVDAPVNSQQKLLQILAAMAESAATFETCASNKHLSASRSLEWTKHTLDLEQAAQDIAGHFHDDKLYFAFEFTRAKFEGESKFKQDALNRTNQCSAQSLERASHYVDNVVALKSHFISLPVTALHDTSPN